MVEKWRRKGGGGKKGGGGRRSNLKDRVEVWRGVCRGRVVRGGGTPEVWRASSSVGRV